MHANRQQEKYKRKTEKYTSNRRLPPPSRLRCGFSRCSCGFALLLYRRRDLVHGGICMSVGHDRVRGVQGSYARHLTMEF